MTPVTNWLTEKQIKELYTSDYWNDLEEEKKKEWWINDGNYEKCIQYLINSNLLQDYKDSEKYIIEKCNMSEQGARILDLAAGIGWTSSLLSKLDCIREVLAVELSVHRIGELFEHAVKMFGGNASKIKRYIGSFYSLKLDDNSIDVIFMSQAFHHANKPFALLQECDRVLVKNGRIVIIGEHNINAIRIMKRFFSELITNRKFTLNFFELFQPDPILGDHYYRVSDYYFMFRSMGYELKHYSLPSGDLMYIADKI